MILQRAYAHDHEGDIVIDGVSDVHAATETSTEYVTTATEIPQPEASGIGAGLAALGIDGKLLAAQIVNFIVLLLILRKFVYGPLMKLLDKRREQIETNMKQAKEVEERYQSFQVEHAERIKESKAESATILNDAKRAAEVLKAETLAATQQEADKLLARTQDEIARQKEQMFADLKKEVGSLVIVAAEKILGKEIDAKTQAKLIDEAAGEVSK